MSIDGRALANLVLDRAEELGRPVTNLQLQKLLFFCHAWHLVKLGTPLVRHSFEAWEFGPVLQYVYRDFKSFGNRPINMRAMSTNWSTGEKEIVCYKLAATSQDVSREAVDFYSKLNAGTLIELSHTDKGPWHTAWTKGQLANPGMRISNDEIQAFYSDARCPF